MKKILMTFSFVTTSILANFSANAVSISSRLELNLSGELAKQTVIECSAKEASFCQNLCSDNSTCSQTEELCNDCVGLKNQTLRTAFTDLPYLYRRADKKLSSHEMLRFLQRADYMLLNSDSYLNIFNASKKDQINDQFLGFCQLQVGPNTYENIKEALVIVSLGENQQPQQFVGVICTNQKNQSSVFPLTFNPEYSKQSIDYFNDDGGIKIKMSQELTLKP